MALHESAKVTLIERQQNVSPTQCAEKNGTILGPRI
jgi:hypothetical protein